MKNPTKNSRQAVADSVRAQGREVSAKERRSRKHATSRYTDPFGHPTIGA